MRNPSQMWGHHEEFWGFYSFPITSVISEAFKEETAERIMKVWEKTSDIIKSNLWPLRPQNPIIRVTSTQVFGDTCSDNKRSSLQAKLPSEFFPFLWRALLSPLQSSCHKSRVLFSSINKSLTTTGTVRKWEEEEHPGRKSSPGQGEESHPHTSWDAAKTQSLTSLWQVKTQQTEKPRWRIISVGKTLVFIPLLIHKEGFIC